MRVACRLHGALMVAAVLLAGHNAGAQDKTLAPGVLPNTLGDTQADLVYTPVTPCRIIDTRLAGGPIPAGAQRSFKVTGDTTPQGGANCGIPSGITSAMINFVAVGATAPGDLRVTPYGMAMPLASVLNWAGGVAGLNLANGLAVTLCDPSATACTYDFTLQADGSTIDIVADVQGYYRRPPDLFVNVGLSNTALGNGALGSNTDGSNNTAVGANALAENSSGWRNVAVGDGSLSLNTTGHENSAFGYGALYFNSDGHSNSAFGSEALTYNTTGVNNSAFGDSALWLNNAGHDNSAFGQTALWLNQTGSYNSAFGVGALHDNRTGSENTAVGRAALSTSDGNGNTAVGAGALAYNGADYNSAFGYGALAFNYGSDNTAVGTKALNANNNGSYNSALGRDALGSNYTGDRNSALGYGALGSNNAGRENTAVGYQALSANWSGGGNIAIGGEAGSNNVTGYENIWIGNPGMNEFGVIRIGTTGRHSTAYIAGISGVTVASGAAVYVDSSGQLGTVTSSARYKDQINDMDRDSDVLMKLRPVSFYYKPEVDATHTRQYGLVAEEVAEVAPELVLNGENNAPQTVRYHFVNAMLLNEVQKQRRLAEEQSATIGRQQSKIEELEVRLAKLEASRQAQ